MALPERMDQSPKGIISAVALLLVLAGWPGSAMGALWSDVAEITISGAGARTVEPDRYRTLAVDWNELGATLATAPMEGTAAAENRPLRMELPFPDGSMVTLEVVESPILAPELGAQYPEIRTYEGGGEDDPSIFARLDRTPAGFHAILFSPQGTVYIDPYQRKDVSHYISYYKRDYRPVDKGFMGCEVIDEDGMAEEIRALVASGLVVGHGTQLRTYRAAVAATGEYTMFHGGTVPLGLAAVTTSMNRVSGVYAVELSIRMTLVPNNNLLIYTNPATDPYSNFNGVAMLNQNQSNIDAVIGSANYDIGHVFSTGGGGVASLGVVCRTGIKARGVTGLPTPIGDPFDIDYVAHEIGHQYGASHCFNGNTGACSGGRVAGTAYEPGSGSTIMAYAGICPGQDLQPHSDDYFVWISIQEIIAYSTVGLGNGCPVITNTGVIVPTVTAPADGFTIPISTPFSLTASATTTGIATYCWEESDLGPAGHPNFPTDSAPIFRTFRPIANPTRIFPKLSDILNNIQVLGEILPSYTRDLSFKCTVRDGQAGGVGVESALIAFFVSSTAGPFRVTSPNTNGVVWPGGSFQTVTWDVTGSNVPPVNCLTVNIKLSTDGGQTFPTTLAAATPNDGSEQITSPDISTTQARVKVEAADNVFLDISNFNHTISVTDAVDGQDVVSTTGKLVLHENRPNPFNPSTTIAFDLPSAGRTSLRIYDLSGRLVKTLVDAQLTQGSHTASWDGTDLAGVTAASGVYLYEIRTAAERETRRMILLK